MRIIGPARVNFVQVLRNVPETAHLRFKEEIAPAVWVAANAYNIDPVGAVAQSAKETNWGNFGGKVKPEFFNTCGLKIRYQSLFNETSNDNPLAHQMFPNWQVGAIAQVQHLRAYAGWPVEIDTVIVDPRYVYVVGKHWCENWSDLGGKWAPASDYGLRIEEIASGLVAS